MINPSCVTHIGEKHKQYIYGIFTYINIILEFETIYFIT